MQCAIEEKAILKKSQVKQLHRTHPISHGAAMEEATKEQAARPKCEECTANTSLYQCPRCSIRTCSLQCCREHKKRTGCSGKRNRGEFLPLNRMTDATVRSDYFFLEEVLNTMSRNQKRSRVQESVPNNVDKKARRLKQQAEKRGTTLELMPTMMERHKTNSSWYCVPKDVITWKIEVIVYPEKTKVTFTLSEDETNIMDHVAQHCEKANISVSTNEYQLYLEKLPKTSKTPLYLLIGPTDTLRNKLSGLAIIEHPTLYCVPRDMTSGFSTICSGIAEISATDKPSIGSTE